MTIKKAMVYINTYKRKYKEGFTQEEVSDILCHLDIAPILFYDKIGCCTCLVKDDRPLLYLYDLELGVRCCLENRNIKSYEFD